MPLKNQFKTILKGKTPRKLDTDEDLTEVFKLFKREELLTIKSKLEELSDYQEVEDEIDLRHSQHLSESAGVIDFELYNYLNN